MSQFVCRGPNYPLTSISSLSIHEETKRPCCSGNRLLAELSTTSPGLICLMSAWRAANVCGSKEDGHPVRMCFAAILGDSFGVLMGRQEVTEREKKGSGDSFSIYSKRSAELHLIKLLSYGSQNRFTFKFSTTAFQCVLITFLHCLSCKL